MDEMSRLGAIRALLDMGDEHGDREAVEDALRAIGVSDDEMEEALSRADELAV